MPKRTRRPPQAPGTHSTAASHTLSARLARESAPSPESPSAVGLGRYLQAQAELKKSSGERLTGIGMLEIVGNSSYGADWRLEGELEESLGDGLEVEVVSSLVRKVRTKSLEGEALAPSTPENGLSSKPGPEESPSDILFFTPKTAPPLALDSDSQLNEHETEIERLGESPRKKLSHLELGLPVPAHPPNVVLENSPYCPSPSPKRIPSVDPGYLADSEHSHTSIPSSPPASSSFSPSTPNLHTPSPKLPTPSSLTNSNSQLVIALENITLDSGYDADSESTWESISSPSSSDDEGFEEGFEVLEGEVSEEMALGLVLDEEWEFMEEEGEGGMKLYGTG